MRWLGYLWNVLVNCFYLAIVLLVFDKLDNRPEAIVVAVIGMTYVAIRTIAIGQYSIAVGGLFVLKKEILRVRWLLNDPEEPEESKKIEEYESEHLDRTIKLYIDGFFLFLVSVVCLIVLWGQLAR